MAENFLEMLRRNPYGWGNAPGPAPEVQFEDDAGNQYGFDGRIIGNTRPNDPGRSFGEVALGTATAPAKIATSLIGSLSPYGSDGWQVPPILSEAADAVSAPGRAFYEGMSPEELQHTAMSAAGFAMGGGGLVGTMPKGGLGMFAGRLAKTADHATLAKAESMAESGVGRDAIWKETGWFQGPDSKWRFEIDDSGASLTDWDKHKHGASNIAWDAEARKRSGVTTTPTGMNTEDFINHRDMRNAYWPVREDAPAVFYDRLNDRRGQYEPWNDSVIMDANTVNAPDGGLSTALHEYQHAIQAREGFGRGASREEFKSAIPQKKLHESAAVARNRMEFLGETPEQAALHVAENNQDVRQIAYLAETYPRDVLNERVKQFDPNHLYRSTSGEVEARNVQKRMNMSPEERRATPPWETQDIPDADQIVRLFSNASKEASALPLASALGQQEAKQTVLDDSLIEILKKYGLLVPGAGYGADAFTSAQDSQY